jgi:dTDP-L-rhamnose 4-epimerase
VHDITKANISAIENDKTDYEIFNIGSGKQWSVIEFAKLVKKITQSNSPIVIGGYRLTDTRHAVSDISKIEKYLNWKPQHSPEDSIKEYISWYKNNF